MRSTSHIAALLLPFAAYAAPLESVEERALLDPVACVLNNLLVGLRNDPLATPYCSSVLGIRPFTASASLAVTLTPTVTSTVRLGEATATITVGRTSTSAVTTTVTTGVTSTSTVRRATATTTISCIDAAYTAPVGKRDAEALEKRQSVGISVGATPTVIPPNANPSQVSSACSCLGLTTNTVTVTPTVTAGATITSLVTVNVQATASVTVTLNRVITSTTTSTVTTTTTTTTTQGVQATALSSSQGLTIRKYTHKFYASGPSDAFNVAYFRAKTPDFTGFHPSPQISSPSWPYGGTQLSMAGQDFEGSQAAVIFQGFYVARTTGTHTFSSSGDTIDNWGDFWSGDNAYTKYGDDNQSFIARRIEGAPFTGGQQAVQMNAGDAIPITWLWANGGGAGQSDFTVTTPGGQRGSGQGNYVPACSAGTFA